MEEEPCRGLGPLLERIEAAASQGPEITLGDIVTAIGTRSFAPVLLLAGLVILAPVIGDIPGIRTLMGMVVILTAGQVLLGRGEIWLPDWLLERAVRSDRIRAAAGWMRRPALVVDRATRPRLRWAVRRSAAPVIAVICVLIASATPLMEVVPFSANLAGLAITAFGLALLTEDGLIGLGAMTLSIAGLVVLVTAVL